MILEVQEDNGNVERERMKKINTLTVRMKTVTMAGGKSR